jgi:hypothetical protein
MKLTLLYIMLLITSFSLKDTMSFPQKVFIGILLLLGILHFNFYLLNVINDWIHNSSLLFLLIPDWKDSVFYKLLIKKYPFLTNNEVKSIEPPKKSKIYNRKSRSKNVFLTQTYTKSKHRSYVLTFENIPLLESEALFISIFKQTSKFLKTIKFGNRKSMLVQAEINGKTYSLHHNVVINNKTTADQYWNWIKDSIQANFDKDYMIEIYPTIKVIIYNLDDKRNKNITTHINNSNVSISANWRNLKTLFNLGKKRRFSTFITPLREDKKFNPFTMFDNSMLNSISLIKFNYVFVHDLDNSKFKFINNYLLNNFDHNLIEVVQDKNNNYIFIKIFSVKFINSHRIFPITELELINLFKGKDLYESLVNAQKLYFDKYYT